MNMETEDVDTDGSICSIHVRNFFCHDNLQVDLNKNVNFIVGRNGSGKSAILTALVVGLGGRASATNRGNKLTSFIKKGANSASIEIKIKNSSPTAYKPELYGNYITIGRYITSSGASSYKIKNASGEVVSRKYEDVNNIVTAHDIQVDNPISVLNQDEAKEFHAADAKKKFALFSRATNMVHTETNYNVALDTCKKTNSIIVRKSEALDEKKKEKDKLKMMQERLRSHTEIREREKYLQNEYFWSEIAQYEREADKIQAQFDKQKAKIEKLVEKLSKMEENFGGENGVIQGLKEQLEQSTEQRTALELELRELEGAVRAAQAGQRAALAAANKHNEHTKRERRKVGDLEREIANIESGSSSSRRAELEEAAAAATAAAVAARARYDTAQNDAAQARQHAAQCVAARERAAAPTRRAAHRRDELKQELRNLQSGGDDSVAVYGANMVALVQAVKKASSQFSAPPRGPIGAYIKVREKRWSPALESVIGGSLRGFCVNKDQDMRLMFSIMGKIYGNAAKPSVTCSRFRDRQHDVSQKRVRGAAHRSALDSLQVDDPVVANYLIDNLSLERILLVPDHDEAQRLSERVENVPENCLKIVTLDGSEYHPAPSYRSYGGNARASRLLHASSDERKRQLLEETKEVEKQLKTLEAEERKLEVEVRQAKEAERSTARTLQALMNDRHAKEEAERVALAALQTQRQPHHAVLTEELNQCKEKLASLAKQVEEATQKEQAQRDKIEEIEDKMKEVKSKLSEANTTCRNLSEEIDREQLKAERGATEKQACKQRLKEDRAKLTQIEQALDERLAVIRAKTNDAAPDCVRVDNPRDKETVRSELERARSKLKAIQTNGLSKEDVDRRLAQAQHDYQQTKDSLDRVQKINSDLERLAKVLRDQAYKEQKGRVRVIAHLFNGMLALNNYSGNMNVDIVNRVLEITCTGRESTRHASSTASLSGGERSYSTVVFIMALWACVEVPFYFMDEFDVFMDNMNRKQVMGLLLNHALKNPSRQFVFLTPQDTSVKATAQISIHKMADPRS